MNNTVLRWSEISDLGCTKSEPDEERDIEISVNSADMDINEIMDKLIIPLLRGIGYLDSTINGCLRE